MKKNKDNLQRLKRKRNNYKDKNKKMAKIAGTKKDLNIKLVHHK